MLTRPRDLSSLSLLFCALLLGACAGNGSLRGRGDGREYAGKTLAVLLPDGAASELRLGPGIADSLRAAFPDTAAAPGSPSESDGKVLARAFGAAFWPGFAAGLDRVVPLRLPDSLPPAPEGSRVQVPETEGRSHPARALYAPDSAWLAARGPAADLILAFGPLTASTAVEKRNAYEFGGAIRIPYLILEGGYFLWDYAQKRPLAQGRFRTRVPYRGYPDGRDWGKAFDMARRSVARSMPFPWKEKASGPRRRALPFITGP